MRLKCLAQEQHNVPGQGLNLDHFRVGRTNLEATAPPINIIESNANFSPVTVINLVNTDRQADKYLYWPYTRISLYVNNASAKFQHL